MTEIDWKKTIAAHPGEKRMAAAAVRSSNLGVGVVCVSGDEVLESDISSNSITPRPHTLLPALSDWHLLLPTRLIIIRR